MESEAPGIPWLEILAMVAGMTLVFLVATARWWLMAVLGRLDRVLTRLGVGTWAARFLTWAERKASGVFPQGARRGDTGGEESDR